MIINNIFFRELPAAGVEYIDLNFAKYTSLSEAARIASMTDISLNRFFKVRTGRNFIDTVNEIRLGQASRMLTDTTHNIAEAGYKCSLIISQTSTAFSGRKKVAHQKNFVIPAMLMAQDHSIEIIPV